MRSAVTQWTVMSHAIGNTDSHSSTATTLHVTEQADICQGPAEGLHGWFNVLGAK